jgi:hypothetical protein
MDSTLLSVRLASHWLDTFRFSTPEEVVGHFGCVQAQDIWQSMWIIGSRIPWSTEAMIRDACTKWTIVRSWPMRGTLHYMNPKNIRWMLELCASKTLSGFGRRREYLGITDVHAERALEIMDMSLRWGKSLTRREFGEILKSNDIPMQTQWVYHLACYAATHGLICFWPPTEKEETFVLLDEWVPRSPVLNHDEQLAELARMYIRWHGPATADDLAWWCGLGKSECKKAITFIEKELEKIEQNWKSYYFFQNNLSPVPSEHIKLLGGFDEYFLGYKDRSPVADIAHHDKLFTMNGIFFSLILKWWQVVGSWKRTFKKDKVIIVPEILAGFTVDKKELEAEVIRYAKFFWYDKCEIL